MPSEDANEATQSETQAPAVEAEDAAAPETADVESEAVSEADETVIEAQIDTAADADADTDADADEGDESGEASEPAGEQVVEIGGTIFVTVQRITPYGAFVELPDKRTGLIHISEIDRNYVKDVREHLREGDRVEAKVSAIKEDGKIDLSIKALQDPQPRMARGSNPEFEQMLRKFMRSSEERQVDVKRSTMHKRK